MRAVAWYGPEDLRLEERPVPEPGPGELVLKVRACAVCGSDLRIVGEGNPRIQPPRILGHEIAGEVVAAGAGAPFPVGTRLAVGADLPCGACPACLGGRPNHCATNLATGYQVDGGFAEYARIDAISAAAGPVSPFGDGLPFELAALAEPLACCLNGWERVGSFEGMEVVVFGAGPIGILLAMLGRRLGAARTWIVEPSAGRRAAAAGLGELVDPAAEDPVRRILEATGGRGADRIFTACPVVATHAQGIELLALGGALNLFGGLPRTAPPVPLPSNAVHYKEAVITGSHGSTPAQHKTALAMIEAGELDVGRLITDRVPLEGLAAAVAKARRGEALKVVVEPGRGNGEASS